MPCAERTTTPPCVTPGSTRGPASSSFEQTPPSNHPILTHHPPFVPSPHGTRPRRLGLHHERPLPRHALRRHTAHLAARIHQHRTGDGSDFCRRYGLHRLVWAEHSNAIADCIAREKRLKRWHRDWKIALIERNNPDWRDLSDQFA